MSGRISKVPLDSSSAADSVESGLARFAAELAVDDVGPATRAAFDRLAIDFVAVALAGLRDAACVKAADAFGGLSRRRTDAGAYAFALGACAHWFDWDDTDDASHVHGGAVILPVLLALWRSDLIDPARRSAGEFVLSAIAGYEIACRVGGHLKRHGHRGWMPTGAGGALGAAAAAARLAGWPAAAIASAMGLASANAAISRQALADQTNAKGVLAGLTARTAIGAIELARAGVSGPQGFLNGPYGLCNLVAGGEPATRELLAGLGRHYAIERVSVKPYPCCRSAHAVLDAVLDVRRDDPRLAAQVVAIDVEAPPGVFERCGRPFVTGSNPRLSAQFSIPYTAALALRTGRITLAEFEDARVLENASRWAALVDAIRVAPSPRWTEDVLAPVRVRLRARDGAIVEREVAALRGDPSAPLGEREQSEKLRSAGNGWLSEEQLSTAEAIARGLGSTGPDPLIAFLDTLVPAAPARA